MHPWRQSAGGDQTHSNSFTGYAGATGMHGINAPTRTFQVKKIKCIRNVCSGQLFKSLALLIIHNKPSKF